MIVSALGQIAPKTAHDHGLDPGPGAPRGPGALPPWGSPPGRGSCRVGAPAGSGLPPGPGSRRVGAPAGSGLPARGPFGTKDLELMPCHPILADISLN